MDYYERYFYRYEHPFGSGLRFKALLLLHAQPSPVARHQIHSVIRALFILLPI
jgi:hypothetical protein